MRTMKDSGIEWIDEIPLDWTVKPLKWVVKFGKGLPITKDNLIEQGVPVVSYGQIHSKTNNGTHLQDDLIRFVSETYLKSNPLSLGKKGDIFFADTSEDYAGIGNAVLVDIDTPIFAGYHTVIVRPDDQSYSRYLAYLFLTDAWRSQLCSRASGIKVFSITQGLLKKTTVILPPAEKAVAMTDYLDRKCSQIDAIITRQQEVIEKLKAYKLSVITEAVTKGLNPDVPMKDSGIEWIGEIPEHWRTRKLKSIVEIISKGTTPSTIGSELLSYGEIHYLKAENIQNNRVVLDPEFYIDNETHNTLKRSQLQANDILFVIAGATIGKTAILSTDAIPANTNQAVSFIRLKEKDDSKYVWYYLQSSYVKTILNLLSVQSAQPNLSMEDMGNFYLCYPSKEERNLITEYLDKKCGAIESSIEYKQRVIERLTAYKKSLIYEVVTGKKEV